MLQLSSLMTHSQRLLIMSSLVDIKVLYHPRSKGGLAAILQQPLTPGHHHPHPLFCPLVGEIICILLLKALIVRRTNGVPGNWKQPHYCPRARLDPASLPTTIAPPWPGTKPALGGLVGETRGLFCRSQLCTFNDGHWSQLLADGCAAQRVPSRVQP